MMAMKGRLFSSNGTSRRASTWVFSFVGVLLMVGNLFKQSIRVVDDVFLLLVEPTTATSALYVISTDKKPLDTNNVTTTQHNERPSKLNVKQKERFQNQILRNQGKGRLGRTNDKTANKKYAKGDKNSDSGGKIVSKHLAFERYMEQKPWTNESTWTSVSLEQYVWTVNKAHDDSAPILDQVYTDCRIVLLPSSGGTSQQDALANTTTTDVTRQARNVQLKFQCDASNDKDSRLQDEPCSEANLCLVDPQRFDWSDTIHTYQPPPYNSSMGADDTMGPHHPNKTAILMMVDGMNYLRTDAVWMSFLNQASYAWRSQRPHFLWVGLVNQTALNQRQLSVFGASCASKANYNTMHYYKPIAIMTLFRKQTMVDSVQTALFLDADAAFSDVAFESSIGPENYFEISQQASLFGWQNGKGGNIMNSAILLLRNTPWMYDFSSLWWYSRCGYKDQRGLWLVLFATWSAATDIGDQELARFAYPSVVFGNYGYCNKIVLSILKTRLQSIHTSWTSHPLAESATNPFQVPRPKTLERHNGGNTFAGSGKAITPIELPHVVIMPLSKFIHKRVDGTELELPGFKIDVRTRGAPMVIHSKNYRGACLKNKCWPFVLSDDVGTRNADVLAAAE